MEAEAADRSAIAIILHMQPGVTLDDGVEAVLLDAGTAIDVRGVDVGLDRARPRHGGTQATARGVRSPLPPRDPTGERSPPDCRAPAPAQDRPRRMDGALAVGHQGDIGMKTYRAPGAIFTEREHEFRSITARTKAARR